MRTNGKVVEQVLPDTNIIVALFAQESGVVRAIAAVEYFLSTIVLGELYFGANKSGRVQANLQRVNELAESSTILNCDLETARIFGTIKNTLRAKGRPLPENDIWIAAAAMQHGLTLVTRDAHFNEIDGLSVVAW